MIYTISALAVIGLCIYVFFAFGLPKIVSCYASRKFKADVSIGRIDLFRRELVKIRFVKGRKLNMYIPGDVNPRKSDPKSAALTLYDKFQKHVNEYIVS